MPKYMIEIKDNMAKDEEIKFLDKVCIAYMQAPDNYLYDFFTGENCNWLKNHIRSDFFPPLPWKMEVKLSEKQFEIDRLKAQVEDLQKENVELKTRNNHLTKKLEATNLKIENVCKIVGAI